MCGIIGVVRRPSTRATPQPEEILDHLGVAAAALEGQPDDPAGVLDALARSATALEAADRLLRGTPGVICLLRDRSLVAEAGAVVDTTITRLAALEGQLDAGAAGLGPDHLEAVNAALIRLKDAVWAVQRDRLPTAEKVRSLAGPEAGAAAIEAFTSVQQALSALDRLEVRGRDSAGLHLLVTGHGLDLTSPAVAPLLDDREGDRLFESLAVRASAADAGNGAGEAVLSFVYKAAAEIGELGDNTAALRSAIDSDELLHLALAAEGAQALVLGHTRWASVGIISEANAHPLNSDEEAGGTSGPYVTAALNGDVDNFADLKSAHALVLAPEITTDCLLYTSRCV